MYVFAQLSTKNMCRRAVSGIPSDGNRIGSGATLVARKSYYDEEYSVYLCGRASLLSLAAVHRFASYLVQRMFGATAEFGGDGVRIRSETRRQAVKSKGVGPGLQGDLSRSASTQRLTDDPRCWGFLYPKYGGKSCEGGVDVTMGDI